MGETSLSVTLRYLSRSNSNLSHLDSNLINDMVKGSARIGVSSRKNTAKYQEIPRNVKEVKSMLRET